MLQAQRARAKETVRRIIWRLSQLLLLLFTHTPRPRGLWSSWPSKPNVSLKNVFVQVLQWNRDAWWAPQGPGQLEIRSDVLSSIHGSPPILREMWQLLPFWESATTTTTPHASIKVVEKDLQASDHNETWWAPQGPRRICNYHHFIPARLGQFCHLTQKRKRPSSLGNYVMTLLCV